jgi:hypothetical protein
MLKQLAFAAGVAVMAPCMALAAQQSAAPSQSPAPPSSINPQAPNSNSPAQLGGESGKQSLAQRLSQSNGTIQPPAVDPGMDKLPPANGTSMPVLKPPPNVQSK